MANLWPQQDFTSMVAFYGNVGEHQTKLTLPYPLRLSWAPETAVQRVTCHAKASEILEKIFSQILEHYGRDASEVHNARMDLFGGCLNVRKVRGGDNWSTHSWGAAIDLDPAHNGLRTHRDQATMPHEIIAIFEAEGWTSMGHARDYDYMHFQAAAL